MDAKTSNFKKAMDKHDKLFVTTPPGLAVFPHIAQPDTKYNADGEFTVALRLDLSDSATTYKINKTLYATGAAGFVKEITSRIDVIASAATNPVKNLFFKPVLDESGRETGLVDAKFKMKAIVRPRGSESWSQEPRVFDSAGNPVLPRPNVGGGSLLRVSAELVPYDGLNPGCGLTGRLKALQILELVEATGGAESLGFDVENGFIAGDADQAQPFTSTEGGNEYAF